MQQQQHPTYEHLKTAGSDTVTNYGGAGDNTAGGAYWSSTSDTHVKVEQAVCISDAQHSFPINNGSIEAVGVGNVYVTENGYPLPAQSQNIAMESVIVKTEAIPAAAVLEAVGQQS